MTRLPAFWHAAISNLVAAIPENPISPHNSLCNTLPSNHERTNHPADGSISVES